MIYANSDCIRPEMKLAALALARTNSANPDELTNDEGQINSNSAPLGDIGGMPVAGPVPNPKTAPQEPMEIRITGADEIMQDADAPLSSSSSTVVEADPDEDVLVDVLMDMGSSVDKIEENKSSPPEPPSRPPPVPPRPLDIKKIEGLAQQQDAAEILNNVFDLLSCAIRAEGTMPDGEQIDLIKKLFFSEVTTVLSTNGEVTRNPALKDHHLISPGRRERPLYAALDDEFSLTELEGVNQFKYELISQASPIQIINVRRLLFEGGKATKDESHLILDDVLYLDRYLNRTRSLAEDALQQLRDKQWQLQRQLSVLDGRKTELRITDVKMTVPDVLEETANFLESLDKAAEEKLVDVEENVVSAEPHLADSLRRRSSEIRLEIESLDGEMKQLDEQINAVFKDCRDHPYRLHSVFMHSGSAKGGHYWIYIFDTQNQIWRKYNDEYVDEVDPKEIFEQQGKATSTSVVYVQEDRVNELTEAVLRKPDTDAANGDNAIEMKEVNNDFVDVPVINGVEVD
jgi:ubiquitin carboxyl-terminal hydrolase 25/28